MDVVAGYGSDSCSDEDTDAQMRADAAGKTAETCLPGADKPAASRNVDAVATHEPSTTTGLGSTTRTVTVTRKAVASTFAGITTSVHGTADSTELPPGWQQCLDPGSSDVYFWNTLTGETSWERPGGAPGPTSGGGSSLLAAAREGRTDVPNEAQRGAGDVAIKGEQSGKPSSDLRGDDTETQKLAVEDNSVGGSEQCSISSIDDATNATDGIEDDFAAAAAAAAAVAAEEDVVTATLARSAQTDKHVLQLAEVIGATIASVLKRLMAANLDLSQGSAVQPTKAKPTQSDSISVFPPEPAPEGEITEEERTRFRLLLQVKGMRGTGLAQLWKQRPALEALERLQLIFSASLLAWCRGELPSDAACAVLESYGCNLARIEEGGLPEGWRCIFHGAVDESSGSSADGIDSSTEEVMTSGHQSSMVGFWYCHGQSGRATQKRPQRMESNPAGSIVAGFAEGDIGERFDHPSLSHQHQKVDDSVPSKQSQIHLQPPPPPSAEIEEQTWPESPGNGVEMDTNAPQPRADSNAVACKPESKTCSSKSFKSKDKSKRKSKGKSGVAGGRGVGIAHGRLGQMVEKWAAAKAELVSSSDEDGNDGHEAAQASAARKRARDLEEWRLATLKNPDARNNANFQPLQFDWRARLKRTRQEDASAATEERCTIAAKNEDEAAAVETVGDDNDGEAPADNG